MCLRRSGSSDEKGWTKITGFIRGQGGLYERFDETASNTVFDLEQVKDALLQIGWAEVYFAGVQDLTTPIAEPEKEGRGLSLQAGSPQTEYDITV